MIMRGVNLIISQRKDKDKRYVIKNKIKSTINNNILSDEKNYIFIVFYIEKHPEWVFLQITL
jgi:hypothetical protein